MPQNTTNLSLAGLAKWMLLVASIRPLIFAWQGIVQQKVGTPGSYQLIAGQEAVQLGLQSLFLTFGLWVCAWALGYFCQRHED